MGIEEKLPASFVLTTVEQVAGLRKARSGRRRSALPACAIEMMAVGTPTTTSPASAWSASPRLPARRTS